jgi:hypothetical protein
MKSNCCQANVLLIEKNERIYKCITCRKRYIPSAKENYMAGVLDGLKIACDEVESVYDPCDATERFKRSVLETLEISIMEYAK